MRCASFNVLADDYTSYGDYSHVEPELMQPGARISGIVDLVNSFAADIVGLQEVDVPLLNAFDSQTNWQTFWSPKGLDNPDGCLTLVRAGINVEHFAAYLYTDGSGHIAQCLSIGKILFANTHIKWAPADSPDHVGVRQVHEFINVIGAENPAVIFADCNDRPGGPVRHVIEAAGFTNALDDEPTAIVNQELVALDLLAVRGLAAEVIELNIDVSQIPNNTCPSDHMPILAEVS